MRVLDLQESDDYVAMTVSRQRWFRRVTETWISDGKRHACGALRHDFHEVDRHCTWYHERTRRRAGCSLAVRLDRALSDTQAFEKLAAKQDGALNAVIELDEVRRRRSK